MVGIVNKVYPVNPVPGIQKLPWIPLHETIHRTNIPKVRSFKEYVRCLPAKSADLVTSISLTASGVEAIISLWLPIFREETPP